VTALVPGDVVDVVAPASACGEEILRAGLRILAEWGLVPRVPNGLFGPRYLYSNEDAVRWRQLRAALTSPVSRAVWCARGGYGSARLLPYLERFSARRAAPPERKLWVGFSDLTSLHVFLNQRWHWPTLHGPVVAQLGSERFPQVAREAVRKIVFGEARSARWPGLLAMNQAATSRRQISGRLLGGNLKTLQSLAGTPWVLSAERAILVLEDVNERGYAVDRMLVQLRQAGMLRGVRALVFGSFTGGEEANGVSLVEEVLRRFAASVRFPVYGDMRFGHEPDARPVPLGIGARIIRCEDARRAVLSVDWSAAPVAPEPGGARAR